jgi:(2Fe-2S) ferredoxin
VKMTACNEPNSLLEYCDVMVYPEQLRLSVPLGDTSCISEFARYVSLPVLPATLPDKVLNSPHSLPGKSLLLVCTHGNRDKRCGRAGPIVLEALQLELKARGVPDSLVAVRASSHIGGHRYAGTLIVYPQGQWYGFMTKKNVKPLLDQVLVGGVLDKCFRGLGNTSW